MACEIAIAQLLSAFSLVSENRTASMTLAYSANFSQTHLANRYCSATMSSSTCALDQTAHQNDWAAATSCSCLVLGALVSIAAPPYRCSVVRGTRQPNTVWVFGPST